MSSLVDRFEENIKNGRNLTIISALFSAGSVLFRIVPSEKYARLLMQGQIMVAERRQDFARAEELLLSFAQRYAPSSAMINTYIHRNLKLGHANRAKELLDLPKLQGGPRALLRAAVFRSEGRLEEALQALTLVPKTFHVKNALAHERRSLFHQLQDHEGLAQSSVDFLISEPDRILIKFAINAAGSAETAQREDLFATAVARIFRDVEKIKARSKPFKQAWKEAVVGSVTLYDIDGAIEIARRAKARSLKIGGLLNELESLRASLEPMMHVINEARRDILERAGVRKKVNRTSDVVVVMPAAGLRQNKIDYPGFREDIRFCMAAIVEALENDGISYTVKSRIRTHGALDFDVPFFSYHTVSQGELGLHIKETDRRSLFSFDNRGYAGWSSFANLEPDLQNVSQEEADRFFETDSTEMMASRQSKYVQTDVAEILPERFVFVGLQVIGDAVQSLAYTTPFAMVAEVVERCKALDIAVVVKRHPSCASSEISRFLGEQQEAGNIIVSAGNIHDIIPASLAVCVINSGVGAEALLYEKPVYVFGGCDYMKACFVCREPGDFKRQFVEGETKLSLSDLHRFWYLYRRHYAADLRDRDAARSWIHARVRRHIAETNVRPDSKSLLVTNVAPH